MMPLRVGSSAQGIRRVYGKFLVEVPKWKKNLIRNKKKDEI